MGRICHVETPASTKKSIKERAAAPMVPIPHGLGSDVMGMRTPARRIRSPYRGWGGRRDNGCQPREPPQRLQSPGMVALTYTNKLSIAAASVGGGVGRAGGVD